MKNTEATQTNKCYCCGTTEAEMVYTKRHGWKCRSAKQCMQRWTANLKAATR